LPIGHAQGLLWANDGLYVVVNGGGVGGNGSGLYRLTYDAATDRFTEVKRLAAFKSRSGGNAGGEHGPHAVRLGPDSKLYVTGGNFTRIPDNCSPTSPARNWGEDLLNVRNPDGGGHDPTVWAPAGWVARCDLEGKNWELVLTGLRNAYDFDFNADGDFFIYDSDMEWDTGAPWYRPTRLVMGVPGGEYGWRNGTGKWPDYYPDSLPTVANMGMGSPTGVAFGHGGEVPGQVPAGAVLHGLGVRQAVRRPPDAGRGAGTRRRTSRSSRARGGTGRTSSSGRTGRCTSRSAAGGRSRGCTGSRTQGSESDVEASARTPAPAREAVGRDDSRVALSRRGTNARSTSGAIEFGRT
jgi:hypothetical protein